MLLAWIYSRFIAGNTALADVGALSFSALATLAPALAFALWRPQTPPQAVTAGVVVAFLAWGWALPLPLMLEIGGDPPAWLQQGPWELSWLAPDSLLALTGWSRLGRAVTISLLAGVLVTSGWSMLHRPAQRRARRGLDPNILRALAQRFLPPERVDALMRAPGQPGGLAEAEARIEHELAAVIGAASARLLLNAARREGGSELEAMADIVDEKSQELRFNQRVLEAALHNMSQSISVVDPELRLVAWNRRYAEMFDFPEGMLKVGIPIAEASRWALQRLPPRAGDIEGGLARRLDHMRAGTPHLSERVLADGSIIEIRGNPMPGGGFVATFTDVTAFRQAEVGLKRANETLEHRVAERTALLDGARREAERANDAKSRFLAAIGHDLLQPLHAAHLFVDALGQRVRETETSRLVGQVGGALDSTTALLTDLLDMSRLEAGGLIPEVRVFPLSEVLAPLVSEGRVHADAEGLVLTAMPTAAWVRSDPQLRRRIVQNFLSNAVRHTPSGRVLIGVRRHGDRLRIEVHDTGPGIGQSQQALIFEEFRRGETARWQGLGLGLAIARGLASVLNVPIGLRSRPGRGSVFHVDVPRAAAAAVESRGAGRQLRGMRVLAVDNDPEALAALAAVLSGWGCEVAACRNEAEARSANVEHPADLWVFDCHLDDGDDGISLAQRLSAIDGPRPCLLLSADQTGAVRAAAQEAGLPLLLKPLRPLALKSMLDRLLAARTLPG